MLDWSVEEVELDGPGAGRGSRPQRRVRAVPVWRVPAPGDIRLPEAAEREHGITQYPLIGGHERGL